MKKILLAGLLLTSSAFSASASYLSVTTIPGVLVDLRYATKNNFMGEVLYEGVETAKLHSLAWEKLAKASKLLQVAKPGWKLLVFDGLRPRKVQRRMWARVKDTPKKIYVADPDKGSVHNFGLAVDLSLADESGHEVEMGTPYDSFEDLAQPKYEEKFAREGKLKGDAIAHRIVLRYVMKEAGFIPISNEWWHFDALPQKKVRAEFPIVE
jgi:D-alanyl-D-alanine dipeptidase